jgi:hypothetical protein
VADDGWRLKTANRRSVPRPLATIEIDLDPTTNTGTQSVEATAKLVGHGSAPDENAHVVMHVTVNADGTITANVDKMTIDCQ